MAEVIDNYLEITQDGTDFMTTQQIQDVTIYARKRFLVTYEFHFYQILKNSISKDWKKEVKKLVKLIEEQPFSPQKKNTLNYAKKTSLTLTTMTTLFGTMAAYTSFEGFLNNMAIAWLVLGVSALAFRILHLFIIRDVKTGLAWGLKIITDPFHDFKIYMKAPLYLMKGQLMDPMTHTFDEADEPKAHG